MLILTERLHANGVDCRRNRPLNDGSVSFANQSRKKGDFEYLLSRPRGCIIIGA